MQAAIHIRFDGKKWHQIPNVGRSIVTPKESVGATRLTGSLSWGTRQIARYSAMM